MNFEYSPKAAALQAKLNDFMETHIYPIEKEVDAFFLDPKNIWK